MSDTTGPKSPFPPFNRFTTTHDPTTRLAVFSPTIPSPLSSTPVAAGTMLITDAYKTRAPPDFTMSSEADVAHLLQHSNTNDDGQVWFPSSPGETLLRYCDWAPGATLSMHRTETLDLGVCVRGSMEVRLDSGETRVLNPGDVIVQRGTMHAWKNPSETEWARVVFFLVGAAPVKVGGEVMAGFVPWGEEEA